MDTTLGRWPLLTAVDRCDSCGAQSQNRIVLDSGHELLFCGHHYRKNELALLELPGTLVFDAEGIPVPAVAFVNIPDSIREAEAALPS